MNLDDNYEPIPEEKKKFLYKKERKSILTRLVNNFSTTRDKNVRLSALIPYSFFKKELKNIGNILAYLFQKGDFGINKRFELVDVIFNGQDNLYSIFDALISNNKDKILAAKTLLTQLIDYLMWTHGKGKYSIDLVKTLAMQED